MGSSNRRHAFVGDVQGCADEFDALLGRLESTLGTDFHLHCVGDMINRGPDNLRVLERLRDGEEGAHHGLCRESEQAEEAEAGLPEFPENAEDVEDVKQEEEE